MPFAENLNTLLSKIAAEQNFHNYKLIIQETSTDGANYTSKLFKVHIKEGQKELFLFTKVAVLGEKVRSIMPTIYLTERFAYTKLAEIYYQLQEECGIPKENRLFFSKFFGSRPVENEEIIVLEDLMAQGYSLHNRFQSVDLAYASAAVRMLAKMHALSLAFKKKSPEQFKEFVHPLSPLWYTVIKGSKPEYHNKFINRAVNTTREENREKVKRYFEKFDVERFAMYYKASKVGVLYHGDYRPSNLMHRERNDGKFDIRIVDLQTLSYGSPITDLLYFIFLASDGQFRAAHFDNLVGHYYEQLRLAITELRMDPDSIYSKGDFEFELKEKLPFGLDIAVFALPVVTVETENAPQVNEDLDITSFSVPDSSDLYTERLNEIVDDYIKWEILT